MGFSCIRRKQNIFYQIYKYLLVHNVNEFTMCLLNLFDIARFSEDDIILYLQ